MRSGQVTITPIVSVWLAASLALLLLAVLAAGCGSEAPTPTPPTTETPDEPTPTADLEAETMGLVAGGAGLAVPHGFGANVFFLETFQPDQHCSVGGRGRLRKSAGRCDCGLEGYGLGRGGGLGGAVCARFSRTAGAGAPGRYAVRIEQRVGDRAAGLGRGRTTR